MIDIRLMKSDNAIYCIICAVVIANGFGFSILSINNEVFAQENTTDQMANYSSTNNTSYDFGKNESALGSGNISGLLFGSG